MQSNKNKYTKDRIRSESECTHSSDLLLVSYMKDPKHFKLRNTKEDLLQIEGYYKNIFCPYMQAQIMNISTKLYNGKGKRYYKYGYMCKRYNIEFEDLLSWGWESIVGTDKYGGAVNNWIPDKKQTLFVTYCTSRLPGYIGRGIYNACNLIHIPESRMYNYDNETANSLDCELIDSIKSGGISVDNPNTMLEIEQKEENDEVKQFLRNLLCKYPVVGEMMDDAVRKSNRLSTLGRRAILLKYKITKEEYEQLLIDIGEEIKESYPNVVNNFLNHIYQHRPY